MTPSPKRPRTKKRGLGFDPVAAVAHLRKVDPKLMKLIDAVGPCTLELDEQPSVFFALARSITFQQLNGKAASTIFGRVCALFPDQIPDAEFLPSLSDEKLRGAGLSRSKLLALRDLGARASRGELPTFDEAHAMDDEAIIARLVEVRGIGRWTAEMFLMFRLGRPDVLPVDDYGVKKGYQVTYGKREMPTKDELTRGSAKWAPYRSVGSWYMWRAADQPRKAPPKKTPAPPAKKKPARR